MPSVCLFSAVVIAGGKSKRMGRDKSRLPLDTGEMLGQRQLRVLNELQPQELFWSGPAREGMPGHVRVVCDLVADAGPLAGVSACLDAMRSELLIVLAVDLPQMTSLYLAGMLARCSADRGAVAKHGDFYEPLAAIYPKAMGEIATRHLRERRFALQDFVSEGIQRKLMRSLELEPNDEFLFKNLNSPEDL
jgi:molybdopterin-guanine dinucleotide biosynthesis protein A